MRLLHQPQREQVGASLQALEALLVGPLGADASTEPASPPACLSKRWKTVGGGSVFSLVYVLFLYGVAPLGAIAWGAGLSRSTERFAVPSTSKGQGLCKDKSDSFRSQSPIHNR